MSLSIVRVPEPLNEPLLNYAPGSTEALELKQACDKLLQNKPTQVPCIINGKEHFTGIKAQQVVPFNKTHVLCEYHQVTEELCHEAVASSIEARVKWSQLSFEHRAGIFLKAAELISGKYRSLINAATVLGQAKTVWQAEIDAIAETVDFLRFNVSYANEIYNNQPKIHSKGVWNRIEYRPLEGFVLAISPFNFSAIGANLASSPAIVGNVVIWKPAGTSILANYLFCKILEESGIPPGVINFIPGEPKHIGNIVLKSPHLAGLHFTGSTQTFLHLYQEIGKNLNSGLYRSFPKIVGETGGKNFHFVHESADFENVLNSTIRSAFEYSGQKCSACSRLYFPQSDWEGGFQFKSKLLAEIAQIKVGPADDFSNFMSAVIDGISFKKISKYIDNARGDKANCNIICGGECDDTKGYFIQPTVIVVSDPNHVLLKEEIFGPVLTVYVYKNSEFSQTLKVCNGTAKYGLTGALFAKEAQVIQLMKKELYESCGNMYINDKCTGAVVAQQPFGGGRLSGTNDKAGSYLNLLRWISPLSIKENFIPVKDWRYPHLGEKQQQKPNSKM